MCSKKISHWLWNFTVFILQRAQNSRISSWHHLFGLSLCVCVISCCVSFTGCLPTTRWWWWLCDWERERKESGGRGGNQVRKWQMKKSGWPEWPPLCECLCVCHYVWICVMLSVCVSVESDTDLTLPRSPSASSEGLPSSLIGSLLAISGLRITLISVTRWETNRRLPLYISSALCAMNWLRVW